MEELNVIKERLHRDVSLTDHPGQPVNACLFEKVFALENEQMFCTRVEGRLYKRSQSQWTFWSSPEKVTDVHHRQHSETETLNST